MVPKSIGIYLNLDLKLNCNLQKGVPRRLYGIKIGRLFFAAIELTADPAQQHIFQDKNIVVLA